jgi:predicted O-linked N-acetylglucosamine transferase (SPINDLY family)
LSCARIFVSEKFGHSLRPLWRGEPYQHQKIRLAYLSGDFRDHAVASLISGVFEHHATDRFETHGFSFGSDKQSTARSRIESSFDSFVDVERKTDLEIAEMIREKEIDIAIDLMGFTGASRPGILAHRPAPLQVNYLGFAGTLAAPFIDYIVADRVVIPEAQRQAYSEQVVYLPDTYLPHDSKQRIAAKKPTRAEAGLPETGFIFCSFNNTYKFTPEMFDIWMRLLRGVEASVLWLPEGNPAAMRNLKREAEARGVAAARLCFAPFLKAADEHLARLALADLFLDTLPFNAHTTAADALYAGLPVLTTAGGSFPGRVAASLLNAAGLPELVTESLDAYETLAVKLAREPTALAVIKARLAANRATHALFDTARFTRNLEAAFTRMWERQQGGEPPASFAVDSASNSGPP